MPRFDPAAAAHPESGLFGLTCTPEEAHVHVLGVPFDATTSYRRGTAGGPAAILAASHQIDLFDLLTGRPFEGLDRRRDRGGKAAEPLSAAIERLPENRSAAATKGQVR